MIVANISQLHIAVALSSTPSIWRHSMCNHKLPVCRHDALPIFSVVVVGVVKGIPRKEMTTFPLKNVYPSFSITIQILFKPGEY